MPCRKGVPIDPTPPPPPAPIPILGGGRPPPNGTCPPRLICPPPPLLGQLLPGAADELMLHGVVDIGDMSCWFWLELELELGPGELKEALHGPPEPKRPSALDLPLQRCKGGGQ